MDLVTVLGGSVLLLLTLHLYNVRSQRYAILERTLHDHGSEENLTPLVAQKIVQSISQYEFPFLYTKSLEFALFKTYGIPSIARVLVASKDLVDRAGVRAEDTSLLIEEMLTWDLNSVRSTTAVARTNQIHAAYGSRITNADLLYTLSLFILEPIRWIGRYEWRPLSAREQDAQFTLWTAIGHRLGIVDIPRTLEHLRAWSEHYEETYMVFDRKNRVLADATLAVLLRPVPAVLLGLARQNVYALLEDRARLAFGYPQPSASVKSSLEVVLQIRRLALRHLALPRTQPSRRMEEAPNGQGRYHPSFFRFVPLYVRPTWVTKLWCIFLGFEIPSLDSHWHNEGYKVEEIGPERPEKYLEENQQKVRQAAEAMRLCPFR
ncbi:protein of unknown function [Taphrina deformans PYCC 5710]|uniref:ER-bound oxygenase mpaB/mpaB'/Rubber oxygenase catalytic domain-containing protein n=1 Tax=Taphrina deformans (strain PYCC 5710 / ATCC 11124 / CBS 356.35 / IMI 108563 / JCM 9778 / NBRC 8474) TaxID=1097556 RepID=R4XFC9_TAPDE|nr:protein of unknown function [Taphrina deformans PYCC 5710]|eukprot:CCG84579.1 protein of unknown function [Taphrina deformans PYCC 5710]